MPSALKKPSGEHGPVEVPGSKFNAKEYLERSLPRDHGDLLKVFPMHNRDSFRVNWYCHQASQGAVMPGLTVLRIRDSKFLYCRLNAEGQPEISYPEKQ
jgi:hypothetical protein